MKTVLKIVVVIYIVLIILSWINSNNAQRLYQPGMALELDSAIVAAFTVTHTEIQNRGGMSSVVVNVEMTGFEVAYMGCRKLENKTHYYFGCPNADILIPRWYAIPGQVFNIQAYVESIK